VLLTVGEVYSVALSWAGLRVLVFRSCHGATPENGQRSRVVVEQGQGAADGAAGQQVTGFVFLEGTRAPADKLTGISLGQPELFADAADRLRLQQAP